MKRIIFVLSLTLLCSCPALSAPGLNALWLQMQQDNPDLNAARMGYVASQQAGAQAQAALLPSLTAGVGSSWTSQQLSDRGGQQIGSNGYAIALTVPLIDVAAWRQLDIAQLQEQVASWRWQAQQRQLMVQLALAWFTVQSAGVKQSVAVHRVAQLQEYLQRMTARFQAGEVTAVDVDEVRAAFDMASADAAEARSEAVQAQETLRQFTGSEAQPVAALPQQLALPSVRARPLAWWLAQAQQHNDRIAVAALGMEITARRLEQAKAEWLPRVDMVASWNHSNHSASDYQHARGFTSVDGITTAQGAGDSAVVGVQLTVPLYNGGGTLARERETVALAEQAKYQWRSEQNQADMHTRQLYSALLIGEKRLRALQQAAASSAAVSASVTLGYSLGDRINADVLSAHRQQDEVRNRLQQESVKYLLNWMLLKQLTGQLDAHELAAIDAFTAGQYGGESSHTQWRDQPKGLTFGVLSRLN